MSLYSMVASLFITSAPAPVTVDITDYGAQSVDLDEDGRPKVGAYDSSDAWEAAMNVLRAAYAADPATQCTLLVPAGDYFVPRAGGERFACVRLDIPMTLRGRGKTLSTLHFDDMREGSGNASKDGIVIGHTDRDVEGVVVEDLSIRMQMPWSGNEQAHGIVVTGGVDSWARGVTLRRLRIGPVASGDGVYLGHRSEGITGYDLELLDCARQGIVVAGAADGRLERDGFHFARCRLWFTGYNPAQENGILFHIEPSNNRPLDRFSNVLLEDCWAAHGINIAGTRGAIIRRCSFEYLIMGNTHGATISHSHLFGRPGNGGDGAGCTILGFGWPVDLVHFEDCLLEIPEGGYALVQQRDYEFHPNTALGDARLGVTIGPTNRLRRFDPETQPWLAPNVPQDRRVHIAGVEEPWM